MSNNMFNTPTDKKRLLDNFKSHLHDEYFNKHYGAYMTPNCVQGYYAIVRSNQDNAPYAMLHGFVFQDFSVAREFDWMYAAQEMQETRRVLLGQVEKDLGFVDSFYKKYRAGWEAFDRAAKDEEKVDLAELSNEEIVDHVLALIDAGGKQGHGYGMDCLLALSHDDWFKEYLEKYIGHEIPETELAFLRESTRRTFVNEYRLRLLEAAAQQALGEDVGEKINDIVRDYYWVENNYLRAVPKTVEQVRAEMAHFTDPIREYEEERGRLEKTIAQKQAWLEKNNASPVARAFMTMADNCIYIQDCRKQVVLRLNHFIFKYVTELAERLQFPREQALYVMFFELKDFIKNPTPFLARAQERQKGCLMLVDKDGLGIFSRAEIADLDLSTFFQDYSKITEVKGTVASPGKVSGRACVVLGSDQFAQFQAGDVLITNQTTPDFVPLMKKAVAIIAEQGGVTSHAAIVSRELGIPCLVGVKNAMNVFASGGMVEVDAVAGVIKKI